jgi:hypothetical protein
VRIDCIDLIRFGHFVSREIEFPLTKPDYYLIYGDNEAGKSTLLRGISALFFGVPTRTPDVHSCKGSELRIGAAISDREKHFRFRRRKGTSGTLLNCDEAQIQDGALSPFLRELDRERFEQFFGLNHQRLREGGEELLRGKGDIGSALFQATGLLDLRNLLDGLEGEAKELFSAKSRTKTIGRAIDEYKQARSEVRRLAISAGMVKQKQSELDAAGETLEKLKMESQSLQQELVRLRRIASNKPDVARLQELRAALGALELVPALPTGIRRQRDEAAVAVADATSQVNTLSKQITERKNRIGALPVSGLLTVHAKEIEELNAGTSDYTRSVTDRPKRLSERDEATQLAEADWKEIWHRHAVALQQLNELVHLEDRVRLILQILATLDDVHAVVVDALDFAHDMQLQLGRVCANHLEPFFIQRQSVVLKVGNGAGIGAAMQSLLEVERRFTHDVLGYEVCGDNVFLAVVEDHLRVLLLRAPGAVPLDVFRVGAVEDMDFAVKVLEHLVAVLVLHSLDGSGWRVHAVMADVPLHHVLVGFPEVSRVALVFLDYVHKTRAQFPQGLLAAPYATGQVAVLDVKVDRVLRQLPALREEAFVFGRNVEADEQRRLRIAGEGTRLRLIEEHADVASLLEALRNHRDRDLLLAILRLVLEVDDVHVRESVWDECHVSPPGGGRRAVTLRPRLRG